ncbi:uncharacterized protein LOC116027040 [Ipomoea triloba]|uniref:uncharacterized protein LOC116027040 n=1 Tax=Ipomoea triloba TaxID=35885 RepID=UPI00125E1D78|nr:uncharacterized protein LOC116027040 [Ipomoea triloba]
MSENIWTSFNAVVSLEETRVALFDMSPLKAPGPDGFHAKFYQSAWQIVGRSIFKQLENFMSSGKIEKGINDTLIALISKNNSPSNASQYRPISLCNVIYKIITKVMTNRIKPILRRLIGHEQSSFVPGRQITDNILIYQEVIHSMRNKQGKKSLMILKIDLEKAYDRLNWDFIRDTLADVGMSTVWIRNIMAYVESPRMKILWNGLVIPSKRRLLVDQINVISQCLGRFTRASGQKVSLSKSQIFFSSNVDREEAQKIVSIAGIPESRDLGKYLGVPTLHVLQAIPYYGMQTIFMPAGGGTPEARKCHIVCWEEVIKPKNVGGLGIRSAKEMNLAFMAMLGWQIVTNSDSLWVKVLKEKYAHGRTATPILRNGTRYQVKDGRSTKFWEDSWVHEKPLADLLHLSASDTNVGKMVVDYWNNERGWEWENMSPLPVTIKQHLQLINLNASDGEDENYWMRESTGKFSVSSTYSLTHRYQSNMQGKIWSTLWKLKVPNKMKTFLWIALHDWVMGNAERARRGIISDGCCSVVWGRQKRLTISSDTARKPKNSGRRLSQEMGAEVGGGWISRVGSSLTSPELRLAMTTRIGPTSSPPLSGGFGDGAAIESSTEESGEYRLDLIVSYGEVPVIVPQVARVHMLLDSFEPIHGVLLCEGEDLDPSLYEAEARATDLSPEEMEEIWRLHASDTALTKKKRKRHERAPVGRGLPEDIKTPLWLMFFPSPKQNSFICSL